MDRNSDTRRSHQRFRSPGAGARAQPPGAPDPRGPGNAPQGPPPTHANLEYAPAEPTTSNGHKLDLYIPVGLDRAPARGDLDGWLGLDGRYRQEQGRQPWLSS